MRDDAYITNLLQPVLSHTILSQERDTPFLNPL
jgi:hypothetical protein